MIDIDDKFQIRDEYQLQINPDEKALAYGLCPNVVGQLYNITYEI